MAKVELELVKQVLTRNELDVRQVAEILEELQRQAEEQAAAEKAEREPPIKKQFALLVSDPEGKLPDGEFAGWAVQLPEDASPYVVPERVMMAAYGYNASPKGRRMPVHTVGETIENVPARFFREQELWVKHKEPVMVVRTANELPTPGGDIGQASPASF